MNTEYMYDIKFNQIGQLEDKSQQEQHKLLSRDPRMECNVHSFSTIFCTIYLTQVGDFSPYLGERS